VYYRDKAIAHNEHLEAEEETDAWSGLEDEDPTAATTAATNLEQRVDSLKRLADASHHHLAQGEAVVVSSSDPDEVSASDASDAEGRRTRQRKDQQAPPQPTAATPTTIDVDKVAAATAAACMARDAATAAAAAAGSAKLEDTAMEAGGAGAGSSTTAQHYNIGFDGTTDEWRDC